MDAESNLMRDRNYENAEVLPTLPGSFAESASRRSPNQGVAGNAWDRSPS